jgi:hypothetical protein
MRSFLPSSRTDKPARTVYVGSHEDKLTRVPRMRLDPDYESPGRPEKHSRLERVGPAWVWFVVAAVVGVVGLFVLHGAAAGVGCAVALAVFLFACFVGLTGENPEDRTAGTGLFGGF